MNILWSCPDQTSTYICRKGFSPVRGLLLATIVAAGSYSVARAAPAALQVSGGWFRYITPQTPAGGYMRLDNPFSHAQVLVGASSPACGMMMLHRSETTGGADAMIEVKQVKIPARGSLSFNPGNFHLMCMQPKMVVGQKVEVLLTLKNGQTVTAPFTVFGASGKPPQTQPSTH